MRKQHDFHITDLYNNMAYQTDLDNLFYPLNTFYFVDRLE